MKADRKRLKIEKSDLVSQMQQLYTTLESREEQLREFIRNYDQHRKVTDAARFYQIFKGTVHSYYIQLLDQTWQKWSTYGICRHV